MGSRPLPSPAPLFVAACAAICWCLGGCHMTELAAGQLRLLNRQRPLAAAYAAELDPDRRRLLSLLPDLHAYATVVVQLAPGRNYRGYYETEAEGVTAVLAAARKTRFEAYTWWFPIVGSVPYKSFFDVQSAREEQADLEAEGYDTWLGHATAYSTLGLLRDPVTTIMMRRGLPTFVEVLFHEMAHARLYVPGQTEFNEQLASFVGRRAAEDYLASRFGADSSEVREVREAHARRLTLERKVRAATARLEKLYAASLPRSRVLLRRAPILDALERDLRALYPDEDPEALRMNNARLMQLQRYDSRAPYLDAMWEAAGGSWVRFWTLADAYAAAL